ncbi:ABC transporter permease [Salinimonas lutimaris]|uniref:ABC transporter permease n=1 Tax=Salinimonas lutimaris TaxID=914153 RepID=UPI0010C08A7C|nr:ABC transporter permease subunit [Salinimonas lutimaris]
MLFQRCLQLGWWLFALVLILPVLAGLLGMLLPAAGYFPALGYHSFSTVAIQALTVTPGLGKMVALSVSTALLSALLSLAGCIALLATFFQHRGLHRLQHLLSPVLVIPHAAAAIAVAFLLSPAGWLSRLVAPLFGWELPPAFSVLNDSAGLGMVLAFSLKELPFLLLVSLGILTQPALRHTLTRQVAVAQSLGYHPVTAFLKVVLPVLYPQLRLPLLAVLAYASASVEIPLILGPDNPPTLAVAILHWFNSVDLTDRLQASAGALLQVVTTVAVIALWLAGEWGLKSWFRHQITTGMRSTGRRGLPIVAGMTLAVFGVAMVTICASLILWSVATFWPYPSVLPNDITTIHWQLGLGQLSGPLANTLVLGAAVSLSAIVLVVLALEAGQSGRSPGFRLDSILFVPLIVPGIAFLYGLVWLAQLVAPKAVWIPVYLSHLVYVMPYVFLSVAVAYRQFDTRYLQVAASLGSRPFRVFYRIRLPMLFAPLMVAFALGLAISFSQYLPTLLAGGGQLATLTTEAVAISAGNSRRLAAVYVIMQMILPLAGFILAWWLPTLLFNPMTRRRG